MIKNFFITGKPASGKTTLIKEVCFSRVDQIGGFYTEELENGKERLGFVLKTFDGQEGVLARKGMKSSCKLNKYGIDLSVVDEIGVKALYKAINEKDIIVIDEIGSMEMFSNSFRNAVLECLNSQKKVLATVRYKAQPFTDEIKKMADTSMVYLSRDNFIEVKKNVKVWLEK